MAMTSEKTALIQADYNRTVAYIALLDTALLSGVEKAITEEYTFGSSGGTGIQREKFRSPQELFDFLSKLEAKRDRLYRQLHSRSILRQQVRL